jgi:hypothetical protein
MKMIRRFQILLSIVFVVTQTLTVCAAGQSDWIEAVSNQALHSVVTIASYDRNGKQIALGSGFVIAQDGLIVTNYHVIRDAYSAEVRNRVIGKHSIYGVVAVNRQMDFAILKIRARNLTALPMGDSSRARLGEGVLAIGNPKGLDGTVSNGIISQIRTEGRFAMLQISTPIYPGNSGGPLINRRGEVIGLVSARLGEDATLGFALPINYVNRALRNSTGEIYSLSQLAGAESEIAAEEAKEELKEFVRNNFQAYENPGGLFRVVLPKNWTVKHDGYWSKGNQVYYDTTVIAPPEARLTEINGYLSEGIRIEMQIPAKGNVWKESFLKEYLANFPTSLIKANPGFALTDRQIGDVAQTRAAIFSFVGRDKRLPEPEEAIFYILPRESALVRIELVTPVSKREGLKLMELLVKTSFELNIK